MSTWGVWDDAEGAFVDIMHGDGEAGEQLAKERVAELIGEAGDFDEQVRRVDELHVLAVCEDHADEEQPANWCEECNAEEDDEESM